MSLTGIPVNNSSRIIFLSQLVFLLFLVGGRQIKEKYLVGVWNRLPVIFSEFPLQSPLFFPFFLGLGFWGWDRSGFRKKQLRRDVDSRQNSRKIFCGLGEYHPQSMKIWQLKLIIKRRINWMGKVEEGRTQGQGRLRGVIFEKLTQRQRASRLKINFRH